MVRARGRAEDEQGLQEEDGDLQLQDGLDDVQLRLVGRLQVGEDRQVGDDGQDSKRQFAPQRGHEDEGKGARAKKHADKRGGKGGGDDREEEKAEEKAEEETEGEDGEDAEGEGTIVGCTSAEGGPSCKPGDACCSAWPSC